MRRASFRLPVLALLAVAAAGLALSGCGHTPLQGAGPVKSAPLVVAPVGDFSEIRADGAFRLVIRSGTETAVTIEAEENLLPLFVAKVESGALVVTNERPYTSEKGVLVTVTTKPVAALRIGGAVAAEADRLAGDQVVVSAGGASTAKVAEVAGKAARLLATGASGIEVAGAADSLDAKSSGASQVVARVTCATAKLVAEGASSVAGPSAKRATAFVAGAASIDLDCAEHLQADATGSSKIRYGGEPKVEGTVGKVASVEPRGTK
jgi:hypothetical protein